MKKPKRDRFRATVYEGSRWDPRTIQTEDGLLWLGGRGFTKKRIREMLKARKGYFFCVYRYGWEFNRNGSISFGTFGVHVGTVSKRVVQRIRKWARSR